MGRSVNISGWRHRTAQTGQVPAGPAMMQRKWNAWEHSATKVTSSQLAPPASPWQTPQRRTPPVLAMERAVRALSGPRPASPAALPAGRRAVPHGVAPRGAVGCLDPAWVR